MKNPYSEKYYQQSKQNYRLKTKLAELFSTWLQPAKLATIIKQLPQGAHVLDVGCGKGEFLHKLALFRPDLKLYGADFSPAEPLPGFQSVRSDAGKLPFSDNSFDLIISKQLIEHLTDSDKLVSEAWRVAKQGGIFYLDCPDVRSTSIFAWPNFYDDPTHIRPYTQAALKRLFELHEFVPLKTGRFRDWRLLVLGPLYLPIALAARDKKFLPGYLSQLFGAWIYIAAEKK